MGASEVFCAREVDCFNCCSVAPVDVVGQGVILWVCGSKRVRVYCVDSPVCQAADEWWLGWVVWGDDCDGGGVCVLDAEVISYCESDVVDSWVGVGVDRFFCLDGCSVSEVPGVQDDDAVRVVAV